MYYQKHRMSFNGANYALSAVYPMSPKTISGPAVNIRRDVRLSCITVLVMGIRGFWAFSRSAHSSYMPFRMSVLLIKGLLSVFSRRTDWLVCDYSQGARSDGNDVSTVGGISRGKKRWTQRE